jgi:hypothetical protein
MCQLIIQKCYRVMYGYFIFAVILYDLILNLSVSDHLG